jgi:hypothetical protein
MQSLQLHLTGAAWSWLSTLPNDSIESWGELESQFARNFCSTYKHPASLEEVKSCVQKKGETLRSYIQTMEYNKKLRGRLLRVDDVEQTSLCVVIDQPVGNPKRKV